MNKNITEMSFDEIFPETPFSKPSSASHSHFSDYHTDNQDAWDDRFDAPKDFPQPSANRTSDSTVFSPMPAAAFPASDNPAPFPPSASSAQNAAPLQTGTFTAQNDPAPLQMGTFTAQNDPAPLQTGTFTAQNDPAPLQMGTFTAQNDPAPLQQSGFTAQNGSVPVQPLQDPPFLLMDTKTKSSSSPPPVGTIAVICAFFAFFSVSVFPLGMMLAVVAIFLSNKDKKDSADKGLSTPKTYKLTIFVSAIVIMISLLSFFSRHFLSFLT